MGIGKKCWLSVQLAELNIKILKDMSAKKLITWNKDSWVMMSVLTGGFLACNSLQAKPNFVQAKNLAGLW